MFLELKQLNTLILSCNINQCIDKVQNHFKQLNTSYLVAISMCLRAKVLIKLTIILNS